MPLRGYVWSEEETLMQTITTHHGKNITILSQSELRDPRTNGEFVRVYCHIHGSDHQRSLSIQRSTPARSRVLRPSCSTTFLRALCGQAPFSTTACPVTCTAAGSAVAARRAERTTISGKAAPHSLDAF